MSKIICGVEDWDSIIDYYRPNGSSKTWYLKELGQVQYPLMWGSWNVWDENGEMFKNFKDLVCVPLGDEVEYTPKNLIHSNKYFYIITVNNPNFFRLNKDIGFSCISEKYLKDIRQKKCMLIILHNFEGYSGSSEFEGFQDNNDFEIIESWCLKDNIPHNSVYYLTGNIIGDEIRKKKGLKINVEGMSIFETWVGLNVVSKKDTVTFKPKKDKYLFLSYNRQIRGHRIELAIKLAQNNLLDMGLFSLGKISDDYYYSKDNNYNYLTFEYIKNKSPFLITKTLKYNLAGNLSYTDHEQTFISVVSETLVNKDTLFLSEKTWKPISIGHPFMILGNKGTLKYLKENGFKTYDKWIDESYDDYDDLNKKIEIIVNELNRFKRYSIDKLKEIREEMFEIGEYNKKHFLEYSVGKYTYDSDFHVINPNKPVVDFLKSLMENKILWKSRLL